MATDKRPWDDEMFALIRWVRPDDAEELIQKIIALREATETARHGT